MPPNLLSKGTLTMMFVVALVLAGVTVVLAITNALISSKKVALADPEVGTAQYIIAAQIKRGAAAGVIISVAISAFTIQALIATRAGTFLLSKNWFSISFIALIYVPLLSRLTLTALEFRDRSLLEEFR